MPTPFLYTATTVADATRRLTANIPVFAFTSGDNQSAWQSFDIDSSEDLQDLKQAVDHCGKLTLAVPLPEEYEIFPLSSKFDRLKIYANGDHQDQYQVSCDIEFRALRVSVHGKLHTMPIDPWIIRRFVHEGKDAKWLLPHYVVLAVDG